MIRKAKSKPTKKAKKAYKQVEIDGNEATQSFDLDSFKKLYEGWKTECGVSGAQLHMKSSKTLLDLLAAHGDVNIARKSTDDPIDEGAGNVIELIDNMIAEADAIEYSDISDLQKALKKLKSLKGTKGDPRNIVFTVPKFKSVNRESGDYDEEDDVQEIYGHYRTEDYFKYRNLIAKLGNKQAESIPPVPDDWWSTEKNSSNPPMAQAMFGGGDIVKTGLVSILEKVLKTLDGLTIEDLKLKIRDSGAGTTAAELMQIPDVAQWMEEMIGTSDSPGEGINDRTGMLRDDMLARRLSRISWITDSVRESKLVKKVAGYEDIAGTVKGFTIIISRRQIKNLALLTKKVKRTEGKETVYLPGVANVKKSQDWMEVLAW
jgi:hypothetical protein